MACLLKNARHIVNRKRKSRMNKLDEKHQLLLDYAKGLASQGKFREAVSIYISCFAETGILMECVKELGNQLIKHYSRLSKKRDREAAADPWSCTMCGGVLQDPVTQSCGHTACRSCLVKDVFQSCKKCGRRYEWLNEDPVNDEEHFKTSILVSELVHKFWAKEIKALQLRTEGNRSYQRNEIATAIEKYSEAAKLVSNDHMILSNRSNAYYRQQAYGKALEDADGAIAARPNWGKGYFRRGLALQALGEPGPAMVAFFQCLILEGECSRPLKTEIMKVLTMLLDPARRASSKRDVSRDREADLSSLATPEESSIISKGDSDACYNEDSEEFSITSSSGEIPSILLGNSDIAAILQRRRAEGSASPRVRGIRPYPVNGNQSGSEQSAPPGMDEITMTVPDTIDISSYIEKVDEEANKLVELNWKPPDRDIDPASVNANDFECSLCFRLFYDPVTTTCGHTYCRSCLDRTLDHKRECPLCKAKLDDINSFKTLTNEFVERTIRRMLFAEFVERKKLFEEEMLDITTGVRTEGGVQIPVFVCTIAFPNIPCPLHVFEPRYRLMIRRCMESGSREFGMCLNDDQEPFADVGTMLEVRDIKFFQDGRSIVDTVGGRRFKVLERGTKDGYNTAVVEFLKDVVPEGEELEELKQLHEQTRALAERWFNNMERQVKDNVTNHYGQMPGLEEEYWSLASGPAWLWWVLAILPLEPMAQKQILSHTNLKKRLEAITSILNYIYRQQQHPQLSSHH